MISFETILFVILPLYLAYWFLHGRILRYAGPMLYPVFGNLFDLRRQNYNLHLLLDELKKKYGKLYQFDYQGHKPVVIAQENIIKEVLNNQAQKFQNRKFFIDMPWPCPDMITMLKDEKWKYMRRLLSPVFTPHNLKKLSPLLVKAADTYESKLKEAAQNNTSIDLVNHSQGFVMEALVSILFSLDVPNQSDFNKTLIDLVTNFTRPPAWINWVCLFPYGNKIVKYIPSVYKNRLQPFIDTALSIVKERRSKEKGEHDDLLETLLNIQAAGPDKTSHTLTDTDILAQGIVVLTAVHVATSFTLSLATYHIAKDSEIQKRCQDEIDALADEKDFPTWEHLTDGLSYIESILKETMRMYPSAFMLMRECNQDCDIQGVGFKKGDAVIIPSYSIHRDEDIWEKAKVFNPDRFRSSQHQQTGFNYLPFGEGPHKCLGNRMSVVEMKLLLVKILGKYNIGLVKPSQTLNITSHVTVQAMLAITHSLDITVKKR